MKKSIILIALLSSAFADDNVFVKVDSSAVWVDNLYRTKKSRVEDVLWDVAPSIELRSQDKGLSQFYGLFRYTMDSMVYLHESDNNIINHKFEVTGKYQAPKTLMQINTAWAELSDNNEDLFGIVKPVDRTVTNADVTIDHEYSPKTSVNVAPSLQDTKFGTAGFTNHQVYSAPVEVRYEFMPKLKMGLGYRFRETVTKTINIGDHFGYVSFLGNVAPKVQGSIRIGVQHRGTESTRLALAVHADYSILPKLNLITDLLQDSDIGSYGDSLQNKSASLQASWKYNTHWSIAPGILCARTEYIATNRKDVVTNPTLTVKYELSERGNMQFQYAFNELSSSAKSNNYWQNRVGIRGSYKF